MATVVKSMATSGVDGFMVEIEASTIRGQQQSISIIGLGDQAVKEAGERIQAAIESCGYEIPKDKVILSLAPGNRKKRGSHFDLGMTIALLFQTDQIGPARTRGSGTNVVKQASNLDIFTLKPENGYKEPDVSAVFL